MKRKCWIPFKEARAIVHKLGLKSLKEWLKISLPMGIPRYPIDVYKEEWKGWPDWLGYPSRQQDWLPFEEARTIVQSMHFKSISEYKKHNLDRIPKNAQLVYKNKWISCHDWLGTPKPDYNWLPFF